MSGRKRSSLCRASHLCRLIPMGRTQSLICFWGVPLPGSKSDVSLASASSCQTRRMCSKVLFLPTVLAVGPSDRCRFVNSGACARALGFLVQDEIDAWILLSPACMQGKGLSCVSSKKALRTTLVSRLTFLGSGKGNKRRQGGPLRESESRPSGTRKRKGSRKRVKGNNQKKEGKRKRKGDE